MSRDWTPETRSERGADDEPGPTQIGRRTFGSTGWGRGWSQGRPRDKAPGCQTARETRCVGFGPNNSKPKPDSAKGPRRNQSDLGFRGCQTLFFAPHGRRGLSMAASLAGCFFGGFSALNARLGGFGHQQASPRKRGDSPPLPILMAGARPGRFGFGVFLLTRAVADAQSRVASCDFCCAGRSALIFGACHRGTYFLGRSFGGGRVRQASRYRGLRLGPVVCFEPMKEAARSCATGLFLRRARSCRCSGPSSPTRCRTSSRS